jgi:hypothetical protein
MKKPGDHQTLDENGNNRIDVKPLQAVDELNLFSA